MTPLMHSARARAGARAFTRLELVVVVALGALLLGALLPAVGGTRQRADRLVCLNNLRQIGVAQRSWGAAHDDISPSGYPMELGGLERAPQGAQVFVQFGILSNELASARLLACPADPWVKPARDFEQLYHMAWRNQAISYFKMVDTWLEAEDSAWAGDRNIRPSTRGVSCPRLPTGLTPAVVFIRQDFNVAWTNGVHGTGNLLLPDGGAEEVGPARLNLVLTRFRPGTPHALFPR